MEELCGLLILVSQYALQEFGDYPEQIGVKNMAYLTQEITMIKSERKALVENSISLRKCNEFLKNSIDIYFLLTNFYHRDRIETRRADKMLGYIAKARFLSGELLIAFKYLERNSEATHHLKEIEAKINERLKHVYPNNKFMQA